MENNKIDKVAIVGGTHGNELAGVYLVNEWLNNKDCERNSFDTKLLLANTNAISANRRYQDSDLNRQFSAESLSDFSLTNYEQSRAKAINLQIGPKHDPKSDLVIDLHNTTSNMGPTLLVPQKGRFYDLLSLYLKSVMPEVIIFLDEDHKDNDEHHLLCTVGRYGVIVEVGPVPQGVLKHEVNDQMARMTQHILDFVEHYNNDSLPTLPASIEAFRYLKSIKLPLNSKGERIGMVHKHVEGGDFKELKPGDPLFVLFDGSVKYFDEAVSMYPTFINEAAYYDNNLAMSLCEKVEITNS
ncbi:aspartoacylase [Psychrosphaera sp. B3R10]|uniref:aspartoacylase n=1 Tax=unclassified Psychrosphaera TaxID=2641570 RepID=UPI001C09DD3A|nr:MULTISPECIES: aspartoacylase [unclassified Psychrosphaera]MBU2882043.1 aspartoacylase [Psychrosphaera sp. I2R16]MBU2989826.1 aspartoacylase [Psychrosphaera sp. B3R10]